ncbi:tRNA epoxyqueuosine(34) reductase QueG [Stappia stellulata]|uniref:tRNA epoxyqueuosine(34) reductase QueG n=1 Tax=Stappia stellulata TaxID=71235 RepID=UPI001CD6DE95|nr:tRNA epoxyqueuosine(34) reductase QueG [Stappia stellulata]MCA1244816.1 tRNA epoxyqueuosine(34) reductase QueG [Stappia stellulata]
MSQKAAARLKASLRKKAEELGFDACAIADADAIPQAPVRLRQFLADGHHATMEWMAETETRRGAPRELWADTRRIVTLAMTYAGEGDPLAPLQDSRAAAISVYARNRDYHDIIKGRLKELAQHLLAQARRQGVEGAVKVFVDTAPVMEKPLAQAAGLGWQGKHTNLVSRDLGSWFFLAEIFTDLPLPVDAAETDHCGSCRACLDVCPTDAFPAAYRLDARRCISYLTIEHKGPIPDEFRAAMGNRIYGCDDCLAACPWNKFAQAAREAKLQARADLEAPPLAELLKLDDTRFRALFSGSPIKRIGRDRFLRNVLIAAGNSGERGLASRVEPLLDDESALVRGAAVWALRRLVEKTELARLAARHEPGEPDADVLAEWAAAQRQ